MLDIKPAIAEKLGELANVALAFPRTEMRLPLIVISENENISRVVLEGSERISAITLQLDVYAESAGETESLAAAVSAEMLGLGFARSYSALFTDGRTPRRCMRFRAAVDVCSKKVFKA